MAPIADTRPSDSASEQLPSKRLGKYRIERQLGAGGMGTVFLAVDTELRRTVALKVLPKERAANPQLVRRFKAEGQAAARLEHDNIVKVFEAGEISGHLYMALEFIDGIDVQELVRKRGMLPVRRSIEIVTQTAAALQHAYERGIVHRDIKPSNLLIRKDGVVKLADMGLARAIDESVEAGITHAGMTVGTVDYISPEQGSDSKQADIRSDLYSLGCSWYHMLTGEVPYPNGTAIDKLRAHATARIPDPRLLNDRIPGAVVAVMQKLMAKKRDDRYQTPQELIDDLRRPSLLMHETGAADIAGLALSDSESMPELGDDSEEIGIVPQRPGADGHAAETRAAAETRTSPNKGARRGGRPGRDERDAPAKPDGKAKQKGGRPGLKPGRDPRTERDLPPRSERPEKFAVSHSMIDPDLLKFAGFGLIALAVISAIGWGIYRASQDTAPALAPSSINPLAPVQAGPAPPTPTPQKSPPPEQPVAPQPTTSITEFRPEKPFPGIDSAAREAGVADVPLWVYEAREEKAAKPAANAVVLTSGTTAADAVAGLPAAGGVIELDGRGPHAIGTLEIAGGREVTLRAAEGEQPVIDLTTSAADRIIVRGGQLVLDGLHLVASGRDRSRTDPLISADAATIIIRNCSITLADPAADSIPAIHLARSTTGSSRCVLENVIVRGNNLAVALLEGPSHEFVAGNCGFATGDAPGFVFIEPAATGLDPSNAECVVQLLASVLVSRNAVLQGVQSSGASSPKVQFRARQTALIGEGDRATALRLAPWPEAPSGSLDQPRAAGVQLTSERAAWSGWPHLTEFRSAAGGDPVLVDDEAQWLQFWRSPHAGGSTETASNPVRDHQLIDFTALTAATGSEQHATLNPAALPSLPEALIGRMVADSARPRVPADYESAFTGPVVTYDLSKNGLKLNSKLNGPECPNGAHVVLTGRKRAVMEPVVIQGKSLRIEFDGGDEPLTVEPAPRSADGRPEALIRVEQGNLELLNARLRIPPSETSSLPLRMVQVIDGSVSIRRCVLHGQMGAGAQDVPVVEWQGGSDTSRFALIEDTLVCGQSQGVGSELHGQLIEVRNSIVASGGDAFRIKALGADRAATIHLADSTLAAEAVFFQIEGAPEGTEQGRLQVFIERTVYSAPVTQSVSPVLVLQRSNSNGDPAVDWWETRSAISDRISRFRIADAARTDPQDLQKVWMEGWGPEHVTDVVSGPLSVILTPRQVEPSKRQAIDFKLDEKSAAATAGPNGGPLGAAIESVGPHDVTAAPAAEPNKPGTPGLRPRTQPNF